MQKSSWTIICRIIWQRVGGDRKFPSVNVYGGFATFFLFCTEKCINLWQKDNVKWQKKSNIQKNPIQKWQRVGGGRKFHSINNVYGGFATSYIR